MVVAMNRGLLVLALGCLAAGCSGSGEDGTGGMQSTPNAVTLQQVQSAVFTPSCALSDCHRGVSAPFDLDLSAGQTLGNVVGIPSFEVPEYDRVERGNPEESYVYMKVVGDPRILGDSMPPLGLAPELSDEQRDLLYRWIQQGANP
jgi:hypothetical protein